MSKGCRKPLQLTVRTMRHSVICDYAKGCNSPIIKPMCGSSLLGVLDMLIWIRIRHTGAGTWTWWIRKRVGWLGTPWLALRVTQIRPCQHSLKIITNFSIAIPKGLEKRCAAAGQCVRSFQSLHFPANRRGRGFGGIFSDSKNCRWLPTLRRFCNGTGTA